MSPRAFPLALGVLAAVLGGCGSDEDQPSSTPAPAASAAAKPEDFPKGSGMSFQDVQSRYPAQLSLGIGASVMRQGENRVPFVVLDKGARPITNAAVALYTVKTDGSQVRGPFPARQTPFDVSSKYLSETSTGDTTTAKTFYAADVQFKGRPPLGVFALVRMDGRLVAASPSPLGVRGAHGGTPPDVGDQAVSVHTETINDVKDVSQLTTRVPPNSDMLRDDFADVLGRKPVVLVFATPALCQSRVCGPVVDVAEQVRAEIGDKASFIHQEVYRDNKVNKGLRPQLVSWRLASEPWIFVIDRNGKIAARFEGAVSVPELRTAVEKTLAPS
jgi:hypothetical protein